MTDKTICIVMGHSRNDYYDDFVLGAMRLANELGYTTVTYSTSKISKTKNDVESKIYDLIDFSKFDGVILHLKSFYDQKNIANGIEKKIKASGAKYVVLGDLSRVDENTPEYENSFGLVVDHLIEKHNCRNIHCLGGVAGVKNPRIDSFVNSMKSHSLPCPQSNLIYGGNWIDGAEKYAKDLALGNIEMPDAVVCIYDRIAKALISELFKNGIKVPDDVRVVGMDGEITAFNDIFSLTTIPANATYHGKRIMAELYKKITKKTTEFASSVNSVITGESCGCGKITPSLRQIRMNIEKLERDTEYDTYYQNSEIQEKLFRIKGESDLPFIIDNHTYLVPDVKSFSVSVVEGKNKARCLFHSYWDYNGGTVDFDYTDILPPESRTDNLVKNIHVLPLAFHDKFHGFATACYHQSLMHSEYLKRFCRDISISLDILYNKSDLFHNIEVSPVSDISSGIRSSEEALYIKKDGVLTKVTSDNILYFEAFDKKVFVTLKSGSFEVKSTITELEEKLESSGFMRISKSILLNTTRVTGIKVEKDRTLLALLITKQSVRVSRKYAEAFKIKMGLK